MESVAGSRLLCFALWGDLGEAVKELEAACRGEEAAGAVPVVGLAGEITRPNQASQAFVASPATFAVPVGGARHCRVALASLAAVYYF